MMTISRIFFTILSLLYLVLALHSCASSSKTMVERKQDSIRTDSLRTVASTEEDRLILRQTLRSSALRSLHLEGSITTMINQMQQTGRVTCSLKDRDSLIMTVYAPFGILVGRLQATPDMMIFYNAIENVVYEGTPSKENFQKFLGIPYTFTELASLLRVEPPAIVSEFKRTADSNGRILYVRPGIDKRERLTYTITDSTLQEYASRSLEGELLAVVRYSDYTMVDGYAYPKAMVLSAPTRNSRASAQWSAIRFNDPTVRYNFAVPQGIPKYRL